MINDWLCVNFCSHANSLLATIKALSAARRVSVSTPLRLQLGPVGREIFDCVFISAEDCLGEIPVYRGSMTCDPPHYIDKTCFTLSAGTSCNIIKCTVSLRANSTGAALCSAQLFHWITAAPLHWWGLGRRLGDILKKRTKFIIKVWINKYMPVQCTGVAQHYNYFLYFWLEHP